MATTPRPSSDSPAERAASVPPPDVSPPSNIEDEGRNEAPGQAAS